MTNVWVGRVTGVTDNGAWHTIDVTYVAHNGGNPPWANGEPIVVTFAPDGAEGPQGNQGFQGAGSQGFQGNEGVQGAQGNQGPSQVGPQGPQGLQGFQGNQGIQGYQGPSQAGPQGAQGNRGFQGWQGPQGWQGVTGADGVSVLLWSTGRSSNVSNSFLEQNTVPTNLAPLVIPADTRLAALSAATDGVETWDGYVLLNGSLTPLAEINLVAVETGFQTGYNIDLVAGDRLATYCSGSSISKPQLYVWLVGREE